MRRYDESVRYDVSYTERQGAYGVILQGEKVLLTHQAEPVPETQLPGGGIDPNEGPLQALKRETLEETGWTVRVVRFLAAYRRFTYMPEYDLWARKTHRVYLCRPIRRIGPPQERGHSAFWVPALAGVPMLASAGDRAMLAFAVTASAQSEGGRIAAKPKCL